VRLRRELSRLTPVVEATVCRVRGFQPLSDWHHAIGGGFMNNIIYIVGLVVVVIAVLSFFGLR
jgi:small-conductance mechanosensitive channel